MKQKIIELGKWGQRNWLPLIIIMSICMMIFLCTVMVSWLVGFWANALLGMHFELASCWSGISVVVTGMAGIVALAGACWTKYHTDSKFNTPMGQAPRTQTVVQNMINRTIDNNCIRKDK